MTCIEECVEFKNPANLVIRGVLHKADDKDRQSVSLICLNTGLNDMVGWHRIQVKIARLLAERGYNVLRFDDTGIGDSEGDITKESVVDIFSDIETGLFVQNADSAVNFLRKRFPDEKLIYLGFCGGGLTAFHSAASNRNVAGVINIGGPVTLASEEYLLKKDPWEVQKNIRKYRSKFFRIRPWVNFFTLRGEYGTVFRSVVNYVRHSIKGEYKDSLTPEDFKDVKNLNRKLFSSFEMYAKSRRPGLFFYPEIDSATWEFKKYFLGKYQDSSFWSDFRFTFIEAERANHILSSVEAQEQLKSELVKWLNKHF